MAKKGGGSSAPRVDPVALTNAQAAANKEAVRESALVNQINEVSPFGTATYTGAIGSPGRTRTVALTPEGQQQLDLQNKIGVGLLGTGSNTLVPAVQGAVGAPLNFEGLQEISGAGDLTTFGAGLEEATFQRGQNLLRPRFERQTENLKVELANQGIPEGSEAYNAALQRMEDSQGAQLENLALSSVAAGRAEQSRLAGLEQGIRQQQIGERLTERSQPINELAALLQGAPAIGYPNFPAPAQYGVQPASHLGAARLNAQLAAANAANRSATTGALIGAGGNIGAALLCSREWKEELGPADSYLDGIRQIAVHAWRYKGTPGSPSDGAMHIGPNAEQFRQLFGVGDGKSIHIVDAIGVLMQSVKELAVKVEALEAHG